MKTPKVLHIKWADQITNNPKKTSDFYSKLLGYEQEPVDEGNGFTSFALVDESGEEVFGIVEEAVFPNWAHGWVIYFEVEDLKASCEKVVSLGGEIITKSDTQCLFKDPSGTPTVLLQSKN